MRGLINLITMTLIILGAGYFFPEAVVIDSTKTGIIVSLAVAIIEMIAVGLAAIMILALTSSRSGVAAIVAIIITIIIGFTITIIALWACTQLVPGFMINGIVTYILLSAAISITRIKGKTND